MGAMVPPLGVADTITVLRQRYPDALVCIACGRLLATRRASWPALSDADRLEYMCAECRQARAEAERVQAVRLEAARRASRAAAYVRRKRTCEDASCYEDAGSITHPGSYPRSDGDPPHATRCLCGNSRRVSMTAQRRGGRPRKHRNDRARWTAAQRARRARQKATAEGVVESGAPRV